jgi:hypothetical protein
VDVDPTRERLVFDTKVFSHPPDKQLFAFMMSDEHAVDMFERKSVDYSQLQIVIVPNIAFWKWIRAVK